MTLKKKAFENIWEKGENAGNQHFLLYPFQSKFKFMSHFYFFICKCFLIDPDQNLFIWQS